MWIWYKDIPEVLQLGLQEAATPIGEEIKIFYDQIMMVLSGILVLVLYVLFRSIFSGLRDKYLSEIMLLEIGWSLIPAFVLLMVIGPSLTVLYAMEGQINHILTIKVTAYQWYWSYEYSDFEGGAIRFDSFMISESDLELGGFRLLDVDNRLVVPINTEIRLLVTSGDVLHCFGVPGLSLKIDAVPGRLNSASFLIRRPGIYYGFCSELCGAKHSFMPIVIEARSMRSFGEWAFWQLTVPPVITPYIEDEKSTQ